MRRGARAGKTPPRAPPARPPPRGAPSSRRRAAVVIGERRPAHAHAADVAEAALARFLEVHADEDHVARPIALVYVHERRVLLRAGDAPGGEEVQHDHPALVVRDREMAGTV